MTWDYFNGDPRYLAICRSRWRAKRLLRKMDMQPDSVDEHAYWRRKGGHPADPSVKMIAYIGQGQWGGLIPVHLFFENALGERIPSPSFPGQQEAFLRQRLLKLGFAVQR